MPSRKKKKDRRAAEALEIAEPRSVPGPAKARIRLAGILLLAALLRCLWLDSVVGGFHSFNEAHYTLIAKNFFQGSLLDPTADRRDLFLETPPLFPWLLHGVFRLTGVSILAGRLLSVAASLGTIVVVFLLGASLFGVEEGIAAALLLAVAPVAVLTGRNIQTDPTLIFFTVLALYFYWRAERRDGHGRPLFGVFFGLALMTKVFAVISGLGLVVWEIAAKRGFGWIRDRRRWISAGIALSGLALYYGYHAAVHFQSLREDWTAGAGLARSVSRSLTELPAIAAEIFWALSPAVALVFLAALALSLWRPDRSTLFVLVQFLLFLAFFFFVHKHSYYLLTSLPWGALLAGRLFARIPGRTVRRLLLGAVAASAVFVSLVDLTSMKSGFGEFAQFGERMALLPGEAHVLVIDREMKDSYEPVLRFYDPKARITVIEDAAAEEDGRLRLPRENVFLVRFVPPQTQAPPSGALLTRTRYGLGVPSRTILEAHPNPHFFRQGRYFAEKADSPGIFGRREFRVYPALALLPVPPELALYRTGRGLEARPVP